jgi:hypothetical protein
MPEVIAMLCSDIHLSEKPPIARAEEPDWYGTMEGYLMELLDLTGKYGVGVYCGGDIFDKWKSSPSLINFAINYVPHMKSVAGQHDLPNHMLDRIQGSAFNTLILSGNVNLLPPHSKMFDERFCVDGFSWGEKIKPPCRNSDINLLVAHKYVWNGHAKYPNAPMGQNVSANPEMFSGYDVALLGDNHKPWMAKIRDCLVYNPGSFMRRRVDEKDHRPQVGLLKDDCTIDIHYLDVSQDILTIDPVRMSKATAETIREHDLEEFIERLRGLGEGGLNFVEAMKSYMDAGKIPSEIREIVTKAIEEGDK